MCVALFICSLGSGDSVDCRIGNLSLAAFVCCHDCL